MDTIRLDPSYLRHLHSQDLRPRRTRVTWDAPAAAAPSPARSAWRYAALGAVVALIAVAILRFAVVHAEPVFAAVHQALDHRAPVVLLEDPVSHQLVDPRHCPYVARIGKTTVYFASAETLTAFEKEPLRYAHVRVRMSVIPKPHIEYVPLASAPVPEVDRPAAAPPAVSAPVDSPAITAPAATPFQHIDTVPVPEDNAPAPAPRAVKAPKRRHAATEAGGGGIPSVVEPGPFESAPNAQVTEPLHY